MPIKPQLKKKKIKVILDSNAFFVPLQFKIDIFEELKNLLSTNFEAILLSSVRNELKKLAEKGTPQMRKKASYALNLSEKCTLVQLSENSTLAPDEAILRIAQKWKSPVFTNDRNLRKKLRNINVPVIYVRQKSRLEIDGRL